MQKYPSYFSEYTALLGKIQTGHYAKEQLTAWWYYVNQIFINFPLLSIGFVVVPLSLINKNQRDSLSLVEAFMLLWFAAMLVFISVFESRMSHFVLFLLLPASLSVGVVLDRFQKYLRNTGVIVLSFLLVIAFIVWSSSELLRLWARSHVWHSLHITAYLSETLTYIVIAFALMPIILRAFARGKTKVLYVLCACVMAGMILRLANRNEQVFIDGAKAVADSLLSAHSIHTLEVYHNDYPHEQYVPQFNYYSNGWLLGWQKGRSATTRTWQGIDSVFRSGTTPRSDAALVIAGWDAFNSPTDSERAMLVRVNQNLLAVYLHSLHTKQYQLYWTRK